MINLTEGSNGTTSEHFQDVRTAHEDEASAGLHPAAVAGASVATIVLTVFLLLLLLVTIIYFRCPQKLVKWLLSFHLKIAGMKRKSVVSHSPAFEFHYAERGSPATTKGNPSLLLIHGFSDSAQAWSGVVRSIPASIHCVALDLPGHGKSKVCERDDLSLTGFTKKLHEFVVAIGLDKAPSGIHVLGHSLGGAIAGNYGAHFGKTDNVKLVTLVCPAMKTPKDSEFWEAVGKGEFEEWLIPDTAEGTKMMLSRTMNVEEKQLDRGKQLIKGLYKIRRHRNDDYRKVWKAMEPEIENSETIIATWSQNHMPSQIIWGTDDRIIDKSGADVLIKILPDCQLDYLEKAGHNINLEAPKTFAEVVLKFREAKKNSLTAKEAKDHVVPDEDSVISLDV